VLHSFDIENTIIVSPYYIIPNIFYLSNILYVIFSRRKKGGSLFIGRCRKSATFYMYKKSFSRFYILMIQFLLTFFVLDLDFLYYET